MSARRASPSIGGGWAGLAAAIERHAPGAPRSRCSRWRRSSAGARAASTSARHGARQRPAHPDRRLPRDAAPDAHGRRRPRPTCFVRMPLRWSTPTARGLRLPPGPPMPAFVRGVLAQRGWSLARPARAAARRGAAGRCAAFAATPALTVADADRRACRRRCARELIDPLVRRRAEHAGRRRRARSVFLRVLQDALFGGPARPTCCCRARA